MMDRDEVDRLKGVRLAEWRKRNGTKPSSGHSCVRRLLPKSKETKELVRSLQMPETCGWGCLRPPWGDHGDLWLRDGVVVAYTSQPYNWTEEKARDVVEWCARLGLSVSFSEDESWHHPGGTTLITIWHPTNPL